MDALLKFLAAQHPDLLAPRLQSGWYRKSSPDMLHAFANPAAKHPSPLPPAPSLYAPVDLSDQRLVMAVGYRQTHRSPSNTKTGTAFSCSDRLYKLGIDLMDKASASAADFDKPSKAQAFQYRDGLIIALLALIPLRRRTLAALRIGRHLVKVGENWALDIPAEDTKTRRALDYPVSPELSGASMYIYQSSDVAFLVQIRMTGCGRPIRAAAWERISLMKR